MDFDNNEEIAKSILEVIKDCDYTIHESGDSDNEYAYLQENDMCITVRNTGGEDAIYVDIDNDEITLTAGAWHAHYDYSDEDFKEMLDTIKDYIEGKFCVFEIYRRQENELKWFSTWILSTEEYESSSPKKLLKAHVDKRSWKIISKAIFRFFDPNKTSTYELSLRSS